MVENINSWINKLKGVDRDTIIKWIMQASEKGFVDKEMNDYMMERYYIEITTESMNKSRAINKFKDKWKIDPITGKRVIEEQKPTELLDAKDTKIKNPKVNTDDIVAPDYETIVKEDYPVEEELEDMQNELEDEDLEDIDEDEGLIDPREIESATRQRVIDELKAHSTLLNPSDDKAEEIPDELKASIKPMPSAPKPKIKDNIPFNNPNLDELDPGMDDIDEDEGLFSDEDLEDLNDDDLLELDKEIEKQELKSEPLNKYEQKRYDEFESRKRIPLPKSDMITKVVNKDEYQKVMTPYAPDFEVLRKYPEFIIEFAQRFDLNNHPPYMQIRDYILNHKIKDPNNTRILIKKISSENPDKIVMDYSTLPESVGITREMIEAAMFQSAYYNFDVIVETLEKERAQLVALLYIFEIFCESKNPNPFEFHIPRQSLINVVKESFSETKDIMTNMIMKELRSMRLELNESVGDVSSVVEKHMSKFDNQIGDAIERVVWKVKTDVEETNLEDIKRATLFILNKRTSSYNLGVSAVAVMALMLDDLEKRVVNENFKIDAIKEFRRYNITEIQKRLSYKIPHAIKKGLSALKKVGLIRIYTDSTFSLSK